MSKTQSKLIIIDGNALIHRSFHALPPTLRTQDGTLVNAVYGFTSFLLKALNEFKPEYVVLTLDMAGPTFRHESYSEYKATRTKAPDELYEQIPLVKDIARSFSIPIYELSGYEADDLIGTICKQTAGKKNLQKIIITGDMDTLQLVDSQTSVYSMSRGLSDSVLYKEEEVKNRYNLRPDQIIDYKALRGDPSDNIPGVRGIGEKTASELIGEYENLDGVYRAASKTDHKIKPRIASLLLEHRDNAYLSQQLATIDCQAPLKFSLDDAYFNSFSLEPVINIFQKLEFRSLLIKVKDLRDKLQKNNKKTETSDQPSILKKTNKDYFTVSDDKEFSEFLKKIKNQENFALALEPSLTNNKQFYLGIAWQTGQATSLMVSKERLNSLRPLLENSHVKKYGHDLKSVWRNFKNLGICLEGLEFDTMIAAYLLDPANRQYDLASLSFLELGQEKQNEDNNSGGQLILNLSSHDQKQSEKSVAENADIIYQLKQKLAPRLKDSGLEKIFNQIEMPLVRVLGEMENWGIKTDHKILAKLEKQTAQRLKELEKNIFQQAGQKFNINSPKQLQEILFTVLDLPSGNIKKTKTGLSTAEDELTKLQEQHAIIPLLQEYRELSKLSSTYLQALPKMINPLTGRIHTNFRQTVAATGRLSSTEPNLQNIPVKTTEGQKVRQAFVAEQNWRLVAFDYSQIELRIAAHMSQDKNMVGAFLNKQDIHTATAAAINGIKLDAVTPKMRREAKAINFGIIYGQGPHGLSQGVGIPYSAAQDFIKKYFLAYPGIKKMMDKSVADAKRQGYAMTLLGRRRQLPELHSKIPSLRRAAERMAINTPIQGTAADMIKLAMINIFQELKDQKDIRLLLQIHDELIFEIKPDKIKIYSSKIKEIMEQTIKLSVPIIVDKKEGLNWGQLK